MIAKYNGKCDLSGTQIIAGETEIARLAPFTVLAEYGTQEAVDSWFAAKVEEVKAIAAEMAEIRGRENTVATDFAESLQRRRSTSYASLKLNGEWVRNEIDGLTRRLEMARSRAQRA